MSDKLRVLVVDDSKVIRKAFARILGEQYDLVEAGDGEEAWDKLEGDDEICAVFTDLNMPHLDGNGLLARIRASEDESLKNIPVILVTAAEDGADKTKSALTAGATDYVLKPFDSVFLQSKAKAHVKPRDKIVDDGKTASMDTLTRLANRTFFMERGEQEMSAANRKKSELALIMMALDDFDKLVENTEKQLVNGLIRKIGSYMSSELRLEDTVGRIEKDRFAILLVGCELQNAYNLAERLRLKIRQKTIRHKEQTFKVSVSVGISALPTNINRTFDMLMLEADRRLQEAIKQGGDAVMPKPEGAAKKTAPIDPEIAALLADAMGKLSRRDAKLNDEEAVALLRRLLPLLEYCDGILKLELGELLEKLKKKYPGF
ncbi:MAG TPA: diguanylate cyclase [Gammaproteobacteria bacterium]|nr:diguanylate cyclase [Gammaproteobacteria bacterium]